MGICTSSAATTTTTATSKVIFPNGRLKEYYSGHVRVSEVLAKETSSCFLCDADEMELEGYFMAVEDDPVLRPEHIYFVLPVTVLRRRFKPEDIAALAVRASSALEKGGVSLVGVLPSTNYRRGRNRRRRGNDSGRKFSSELGVILE